MRETQHFAIGPSGNFDVPIDHSEINKQVPLKPPAPLPEEYESPYLVPESIYEKAGRTALLGQTSLTPAKVANGKMPASDVEMIAA